MLLWLLVLAALALVLREKSRREDLQRKVDQLSTDIDRLSHRLRELMDEPRERPRTAESRPVAPPVATPSAKPVSPPPAKPVTPPPAKPVSPPAAKPLASPPAVALPADMPPAPRPAPVPPPPSSPPRRLSLTGDSDGGGIDWERFVGVKLFSWIAAIALVIAGVYFMKYSMDHGWLAPPVRMAIGIVTGIGLLIGCELKVARRYAVTANALDAAGIAILFSTFFAAHVLWQLINAPVTFALLTLVTATAVLLSIRRESLFIAALGLLGGFATPALISTGKDNPIGLFGYLLVLNAGLAWVAYRKRWPVLTAASLAFTTLYQWGWVGKFLTAGKLPLAIGIFLIFPVLSFTSLILGERRAPAAPDAAARAPGKWETLFARTAWASAALPLVFAVYLATVPGYGEHFALLFGFLLVVDIGLSAIAIVRGPQFLHLAGAATSLVVWATWLNTSYVATAWPWVLALVAPFVALYLVAGPIARRLNHPFDDTSARAVFAAPLLLFVFPMLVSEPLVATPWLLFGTMFVLLAGCAWYAIAEGEGAVHFIAAFFALAAEALWSSRYLSADRLLPALTIYLAFGLFYISVPIVARRLGRALEPKGVGGLITLVSIALLFFIAGGSVASSALWGLALLLAVLNAGIFVEASSGKMPLLSMASIVLSWLVLAVWWATASIASVLVPALAVLTGFALLAVAGNVWAQRRAPAEESKEFEGGAIVGLAGHLFLLFVASRPDLSIPPWPVLGVLLVLNLAMGTAALYFRQALMWVAALAASAVVLLLWLTAAPQAPWPTVAVSSAGALVALGFAWVWLTRRAAIATGGFELAAVAATLLAQGITVVAGTVPVGAPGLGFLVGANLVLMVAAFGLAAIPAWRRLAILSVVVALIGALLWQTAHTVPFEWQSHLWYATPLYLVAVVYPLVLGRRAGTAKEPYLAAVVASVIYFFIARWALDEGGFASVIGALPVAQGALLAMLLARLLRMERPGERALGRLALVSGAALAFVTVAIPLQLDRQWITIGLAIEGAALAWLYGRIRHRGLLLFAAGLFTATFVRLALNPSVLEYHARSDTRIWNWYLYAYMVCAAAMFLGSWLFSRTDDRLIPGMPRLSTMLPTAGTVLLFLLLNIEIADFYAVGAHITFNFTATLAQDLTYTLGWAVFALALLAAGIALTNRAARIAAIGLLVVTIAKCFFHDLARLGGLYRVMSFVGLAICLSLVAVAIQKFVLGAPKRPTSPVTPDTALDPAS